MGYGEMRSVQHMTAQRQKRLSLSLSGCPTGLPLAIAPRLRRSFDKAILVIFIPCMDGPVGQPHPGNVTPIKNRWKGVPR